MAKVCGVAQHVYVHEFGDIAVLEGGVLFVEDVSQCGAFFGDDLALFCGSLALTH